MRNKIDLENALLNNGIATTLVYSQSLTSAVTTAWGVDWNEEYIARDLMQNFFDANRSDLTSVKVLKSGLDVMVSGKAKFDLSRLFYLGSEKSSGDVGQYGEGFKAASVCLLRNHGVTPIAVSGKDLAVLRVSESMVENTQLSPIVYDFYKLEESVDGTRLILPNCSAKLSEAMHHGLSHFFYSRNPLLGTLIFEDASKSFALFNSANAKGHVFYRNLKRGSFEGIPVVLVINKEFDNIERKISRDRDRNAFGEDVMDMFFKRFANSGMKYNLEGQEAVVASAKNIWEKGHPFLSAIASSKAHNSYWSKDRAERVFGNKYYSKTGYVAPIKRLEIDRIERKWQEEGKVCLPGYFEKFGVINAECFFDEIQKKASAESKLKNQRLPSSCEQDGIKLLKNVLSELAPVVTLVFDRGYVKYSVAKTDVLLGELKRDRAYNSREVFLSQDVFVSDFASAVSVFLHEHAHVFGADGSRGFTDTLTEMLEMVLRHRHDMDQYEAEWEKVRAAVLADRAKFANTSESEMINRWVDGLGEGEMRKLLGDLPLAMLRKMQKTMG